LKKDYRVKNHEIIQGVVKNVTLFDSENIGVFVSTEYGDGLIHQSEISNYKFDYLETKNIFSKGDKIPVFVISYNKDNLNLGFKQLIGTRFENKYFEILKK